MASFLLLARVALAAVFLVAGVAKLADRSGSQHALAGFGVPAVLQGPLGLMLPVGEVAVALALFAGPTAWWGALGALSLLLIFSAAIGYNLFRGRAPECHCFGQFRSAPAGWPAVARNTLLAAIAAVILWYGRLDSGASAISWLERLDTAERVWLALGVLAVGLLAAQTWLILQLVRQNGQLLLRFRALDEPATTDGDTPAAVPPPPSGRNPSPRGLPLGSPAPAFALPDLGDQQIALDALRVPGRPVLLVFADPTCGPCERLLPEIGAWQRSYASRLVVAMVSRGTREANQAKSTVFGMTRILLQQDREVAQAYEATAFPSAVLVRPDGTIGSAVAVGAARIRALVTSAVS